METGDFCTSKVFSKEGAVYVVIAEHCNKLYPNWAPELEVAFRLNCLIKDLFQGHLTECQEGIFESTLSTEELETSVRVNGFIYNPLLDEIGEDFIDS